jgi:transposase-like protein
MIILICPTCESAHIERIAIYPEIKVFQCEDCNLIFGLDKSDVREVPL